MQKKTMNEKERAAIEAQALAAEKLIIDTDPALKEYLAARWRREIATTMPAAVAAVNDELAAAKAFADKRLGCCFCRLYNEFINK